MERGVVLFVLTQVLLCRIQAANILLYMPVTSISETLIFYPLSQELVKSGHTVTVISPYEWRGNATGINFILSERSVAKLGGDLLHSRVNKEGLGREWELQKVIFQASVYLTEGIVRQQNIHEMYRTAHFDLIIINGNQNECGLAFAHHFRAPIVYVEAAGLHPWRMKATGNLYLPSTTPSVIGGDLLGPMTMKQKYDNFFRLFNWHWYREQTLLPQVERLMKTHGLMDDSTPPLIEIEKNASLLLVHRDPLLEYPYATLPNVVKLGCLNCREARPLPEDYEAFIQGSGDAGFVYFSFGSFARLNDNVGFFIKNFFSAFAQIPQRVLVKWDKKVTNEDVKAPPNVKFVSWAPQQDVIGHPKCRVFITHAGLFSTHEAVYHGVPVLAFPLFWDQEYNAGVLERQGMAISMEVSDTTPSTMLHALKTIINTPSYKKNAKKLSILIRDQPIPPMKLAIYWIEYVLRHKGTGLLRPHAVDMPWHEIWMLDLFAIVLLTVTGCVVVSLLYGKRFWKHVVHQIMKQIQEAVTAEREAEKKNE